MKYKNSECRVTPDEPIQSNDTQGCCANSQTSVCDDEIKNRLRELQFAAIDLNLFLDTHPQNEEALEMFKKINKTIEALKIDYVSKFGPLAPADSAATPPFEWASREFKWPWEK